MPAWGLGLLNCWRLEQRGQLVEVPARQQRVIAAVAIVGGRSRGFYAGLLWPDATERHATQSLRTCLWQITHSCPGLLAEPRNPLSLNPDVVTDLQVLFRRCEQLRPDAPPPRPEGILELLRSAELLPGWYEEWLLPEQEHLRRTRLHALEVLAESQLRLGLSDAAAEAAEVAALIDPFRESTQRLLIRSHLAAGNYAAALRSYSRFRAMLDRELGLAPSARLTELIRELHR